MRLAPTPAEKWLIQFKESSPSMQHMPAPGVGRAVMRNDEHEYLAARAEAEVEAAAKSATAAAVQAHYRMAEAYLDRLYPPEEEHAAAN